MVDLSTIARQAVDSLEKKTFGGVSKESAVKGIQSVKEAGEKCITELRADINGQSQIINNQNSTIDALNQKLASVNATNQYQAAQLAENEEAIKAGQEVLNNITLKLNKTEQKLKTKTYIQEHSDGSQTIRKSNKNGTRMTIEKDSAGRKQSIETEQLDGSLRTTKFNKETGIRETTTTNYNSNIVEYDLAGKTKTIKGAEDVRVINRFETQTSGHIVRPVNVEELSNGSKIEVFRPVSSADIGIIQKKNNNGNITEQLLEQVENDTKTTLHLEYGENKVVKTGKLESKWGTDETRYVTKQDARGNDYLAEATVKKQDGETIHAETVLNHWGAPEKQIVTVKFPENNRKLSWNEKDYGFKEARIEYKLVDMGEQYAPAFRYDQTFVSATMVTKDGKEVVLTNNWSNDLVTTKNQVTGNIQSLLQDDKVKFIKDRGSSVSPSHLNSITPTDFMEMNSIPRNIYIY